jgi:hypothetical protein
MFDVRLDDADPETETGPIQGIVRLPRMRSLRCNWPLNNGQHSLHLRESNPIKYPTTLGPVFRQRSAEPQQGACEQSIDGLPRRHMSIR